MCLPVIALAMTAASGAMAAYGQYQQGKSTQQIANNNATMAGYAAQDAQRRGEIAAQGAQRQADQVEGATRARLGAGGVDLGVGTAAGLQAQNDFFGAANVGQARENAAREGWSDNVQAQNFRTQGDVAMQQGRAGAFSTTLGTAGTVAGRWYSYTNPQPANNGNGGMY